MTEKDFSLRLAKLRAKKGVSAREMSLAIGQNQGYINNIEVGKSMPSFAGILYICEYLGITPSELFDTESSNPGKIDDIVQDMKRLDDAQLDMIAILVKGLIKNNSARKTNIIKYPPCIAEAGISIQTAYLVKSFDTASSICYN